MPLSNYLKSGLGFGLTSGVITTLGLIVGLNSSTHSRLAVIGGIFVIAVADAFSDALGIHVSKETETNSSTSGIWVATFSTFFSKIIIASSFVLFFIIFSSDLAVYLSIIWGILILSVFSFYISKIKHSSPWSVISEHLLIAILVIIISYYIGDFTSRFFS